MKVLFLTRYDFDGPSSRYRSYNYHRYFAQEKLDVVFKPFFGKGYVKMLYRKDYSLGTYISFFIILRSYLHRIFIGFKLKQYDVIVIEKELFPYFPYWLESIFLRGKNYYMDFDDNIQANYQITKWKNFFWGSKIKKLVEKSQLTTVGNLWYFEQFNGNLKYLPTVVDLDKYPDDANCCAKSTVTIVWIGTLTTVKNLEIVEPVLYELSKKYSLVLKVIGPQFNSDRINIQQVEWSAEREVAEILNADIGIMPLFSSPWEKGKCGFKLIQYMACGLPVVASPSPANEEIVVDKAFIASSEKEWYTALEDLIKNPSLRSSIGKRGRKRVVENYSYQVWGPRYAKLIHGKS